MVPASQPPPPPGPHLGKVALRDQVLTARSRKPPSALGEAAARCAEHVLALPEVRRAATVAAYAAVGSEPGTALLLEGLLAARKRVILPLVQPDLDLDWGVHSGQGTLWPARLGLLEPTGTPLGREEIAHADVVIVPGLAVDATGLRMGRGGGCYDRALARVMPGVLTCVLLYPDELDRDVPGEAHDARVGAAITAEGVRRF